MNMIVIDDGDALDLKSYTFKCLVCGHVELPEEAAELKKVS